MNKIINKTALYTVFSLIFVLVPAVMSFGQNSGDQKSESPSNPTVNAANPQTVDARQSGVWSVGIDPSRNTVQLTNTPTDPLPVRVENTSRRTPFQKRVSVAPTGLGISSAPLPIPAGKRLVIENVSVIGRCPEGLRMEVNFFTYMNNGDDVAELTFHRFALIDQGTFDGTAVSVANNKVQVFADEQIGTNHYVIYAQARLSGSTTGFAQAQFTFSGYLEDLPVTQ